ncbi:MAG TPA: cyclopropane-fatty-acyl-phospholipid synthase family protein [Anaerolineales bacterium]|nr:cyclopropane-fatty-acyl-phospholipid synthase family protein [Anaerolineales bacterium]
MSTMLATKTEELTVLIARILSELFDAEALRRVHVRLWDGSYWPDAASRAVTLVLKHPGALRAMFLPGTEVGLGEAYIYDDFDIEGDIEQLFSISDALMAASSGLATRLRLGRALMQLPDRKGRGPHASRRGPARLTGKVHSIERDRQAVTYHYNVSNDFYALWLDRNMVYSCAYFHSPADSLDAAQEQKLEHICRKLRLRPGERLLDIGCGWGGLAIYAARNFSADVTGITLSQPQADLANARIREAGLAERCRVLVRDYRELDELEAYDALVSVGMFEHVGAAMLPAYFDQARRLLRPGGVFLNHGIAIGKEVEGPSAETSFSQAYVFPDGELEPIHVTLQAAEGSGFEVRDIESLREHYALTLRQWINRLEAHHTESLAFVDEPIYRTWRLYMSASAYGFSDGRLTVYQTLLAKPDKLGRSGLPLTRDDWYRPDRAD